MSRVPNVLEEFPERLDTVLAACAIARLALPLIPEDDPVPRGVIEAVEAWATTKDEQHLRGMDSTANDLVRNRLIPGSMTAYIAVFNVAQLPTRMALESMLCSMASTVRAAVAVAWSNHHGDVSGDVLSYVLSRELWDCFEAMRRARRRIRHPPTWPVSALEIFLRQPTREGAFVALDELHEGRAAAIPAIWGFAWLYAHVDGVAP